MILPAWGPLWLLILRGKRKWIFFVPSIPYEREITCRQLLQQEGIFQCNRLARLNYHIETYPYLLGDETVLDGDLQSDHDAQALPRYPIRLSYSLRLLTCRRRPARPWVFQVLNRSVEAHPCRSAENSYEDDDYRESVLPTDRPTAPTYHQSFERR